MVGLFVQGFDDPSREVHVHALQGIAKPMRFAAVYNIADVAIVVECSVNFAASIFSTPLPIPCIQPIQAHHIIALTVFLDTGLALSLGPPD